MPSALNETDREVTRAAPRPSFFLVGAPRCGTTALFRWLGQHAELHLSTQKECHYFAHDIPGFRDVTNEADYLNQFRNATPSQRVGEASVLYLRSACAIDEIIRFAPHAQLLVTLRNPIEIVQSWHEQLLVTGQEDVEDLSRAWRLQPARQEGHELPSHCMDPMIPQYEAIARLGEQVEKLLTKCDREQALFLRYEDLRQDPASTYRRVLAWLGAADDGFDHFRVVNANKQVLPLAMQRMWMRNPGIKALRGAMRRAVGETRYAAVRDALTRRLGKATKRERMEPALRKELEACFRRDVERLSDVLQEDFRPWLKKAG